jgi:cadmium resistance protein CadD (predicted permease)
MRRQDEGMLNVSPPRTITFLVSLVLIGLAIASLYMRIPTIGHTVVKFRTWFFVAAYVVLALGIVSKSL